MKVASKVFCHPRTRTHSYTIHVQPYALPTGLPKQTLFRKFLQAEDELDLLEVLLTVVQMYYFTFRFSLLAFAFRRSHFQLC